jgi:hypothetical protein
MCCVTNPESIAVEYYFATASGRLEKVEQTAGIETLPLYVRIVVMSVVYYFIQNRKEIKHDKKSVF